MSPAEEEIPGVNSEHSIDQDPVPIVLDSPPELSSDLTSGLNEKNTESSEPSSASSLSLTPPASQHEPESSDQPPFTRVKLPRRTRPVPANIATTTMTATTTTAPSPVSSSSVVVKRKKKYKVSRHLSESDHQCPNCSYSTRDKSNFKRHIKKKSCQYFENVTKHKHKKYFLSKTNIKNNASARSNTL